MNSKRKVYVVITILSIALIVCVSIVLIESQIKVIRRWIDDTLYDNRNHHLPCKQLPPLSEVKMIVREHQDIIKQVEAVHPGNTGAEILPCGTGQNADITFWYASHNDRIAIEQIIGADTFFGVPYNLDNR
jgi:hypothetical protein